MPFRGDCKMAIRRIVEDLEVDDEQSQPFKRMRYPIEDGQKHKKLMDFRQKWFVDRLNFDEEKASEWTNIEFTAFSGTHKDLVDLHDPGHTITKLVSEGVDPKLIAEAQIETKKFFSQVQDGMILITPMKTYQKNRFYHGMDLDAIKLTEWPPAVSFWTANSPALANQITQINIPGEFSLAEENRTIQIEKSSVFVAKEFGRQAEEINTDHQNGHMDFLQYKMSAFEGQSRPGQARRRFMPRGGSPVESSDEEMPALENSKVSSDEEASSITTDNETIIGSEYNKPRLSLDPAKALPVPIKPDPVQRLDTGRSSITRHDFHKSNVSTFVPDDLDVQPDRAFTEENLQKRPKRAFWGRAFIGMGQFCPNLHGTSIFPLPPRQEKMYYNVATNAPLDHMDGELDPIFMDDIKIYMKPILGSLNPPTQNRAGFLSRLDKLVYVDWKTKFPYASHRLQDFNSAYSQVSLLFYIFFEN